MSAGTAPPAVSGEPLPEPSCTFCAAPYKGLELKAAGYHPALYRTDWLRSPRLGRLRVCKHCFRLWTQHRDSREHYTWYADMGPSGAEVLKATATPNSLIRYTALNCTDRGRYWIPLVADAWMRRDPAWAPQLFNTCCQSVSLPVIAPGDLAAERRVTLVVLACDAHAYLSSDERQAVTHRQYQQLLDAGLALPLPSETRGYNRGQRLDRVSKSLAPLKESLGDQWNPDQWLHDGLLDLLEALPGDEDTRRDLILEYHCYLPTLLRLGARVPGDMIGPLDAWRERLMSSERHPDRVAFSPLHELCVQLSRARQSV